MTSKSLDKILTQLPGEETDGFSELSPEEAEELAGGTIGLNGACGNKSCPTSNTTCTGG